MTNKTNSTRSTEKETKDAPVLERDPKWEHIQAELLKPFPSSYISVKPGATSDSGQGLVLWYVDARAVMNRLDQVVGPENWSFTWQPVSAPSGRVAIHGSLRIFEAIKEDVGEAQDEDEPFKSAVSDAFKRCAVHFGLGRYLYSMPQIWWPYDKSRRRFSKMDDLQRFIDRVVDRLIEACGDATQLDVRQLQMEASGESERTAQHDRSSQAFNSATPAQQDAIRDLQIQKFGASQDAKTRYDQFQKGMIGRACKRSEMTKLEADKVIKGLIALPQHREEAA